MREVNWRHEKANKPNNRLLYRTTDHRIDCGSRIGYVNLDRGSLLDMVAPPSKVNWRVVAMGLIIAILMILAAWDSIHYSV